MLHKKEIFAIVFIACCLSLTLGMMDYETESFVHLLTSDPGNIIALIIYAAIFALIGLGMLTLFRLVSK